DGPEETSEDCSDEALENEGLGSISEQILDARPDVTLGGGAASFDQTAAAGDWKDETLLQQAEDRGYQLVDDADSLDAVTEANQDSPVLGLFRSDEALENEGLGSISEQILDARPDVTLGGGAASFDQTAAAGDWKDETLLQQAEDRGYQLVDDADSLDAVTEANQDSPVLGLF